MLKNLIKKALKVEMNGHLYKYFIKCYGKGKRQSSVFGTFYRHMPRHMQISFEPGLVKKRKNLLEDNLSDNNIELYGLGRNKCDISSHIMEIREGFK
ncbi:MULTISPECIES: hypothetical protein [Maribacter]|uniref:Uncharacterized protein n=1 Tax=Maribacter flavus TaxID=1658664 RepID=A0ABU7IHW3_9FLAO|nr:MULTISPECIES: hypothetical protein [Maribacter]MDC6405035.1 hypothetical protein [Maribacter sp. PR66]MEE1972449.1 hypothetical protein [Maribacter flavus]